MHGPQQCHTLPANISTLVKVENDVYGISRTEEIAYLDRLLTLSLDVTTVNSGSHILHDNWPWATIHKDAAICKLQS